MEHQQHAEHADPEIVTIEMDTRPHPIRRGHRTVAEIKVACDVPQSKDIALIGPNGQLKPLPEDGSLMIEGRERFISHKRSGGSA